jgi:hypothetical protein
VALLSNSKTVFLSDGTLSFSGGDFTFDFTENKNFVQVELEAGQTTNLTQTQFNSVSKIVVGQDTHVTIDFAKLGATDIDFQGNGSVNLTGITFTSADKAGNFKFEPNADSTNLDAIVKELIAERGVSGAVDALTINGNKADAFKVIWDHLDDNYSTYYNTALNDCFIDLGIAYAKYLKAGGTAIMDVAKYSPDGGDANTTPDRMQTMHDNLLGNLDEASIRDKFGTTGDDAIYARIQDAGFGPLLGVIGNDADGRGIYGGYDTQDPTQQRTFDHDYFMI